METDFYYKRIKLQEALMHQRFALQLLPDIERSKAKKHCKKYDNLRAAYLHELSVAQRYLATAADEI